MIRIAGLVLVNSAVVVILLFIIEGFSSYIFVAYRILTSEPVPERVHTEYDEELGWINLPNVSVKDMYGRGVYLTTNSQRYRNSHDLSPRVPDGKVRIVCSGDSFTLGYGVDDDHTWCQLLTLMDEHLETVNLGQGGYGIDQAYLWYKRNEPKLEHNIQIFAFITDDFLRTGRDSYFGYGKPYLRIRANELYQDNRPVPKRSYYAPWFTGAVRELKRLNTVQLFGKLADRLVLLNDDSTKNSVAHTEEVISKIFAELQKMNRTKMKKRQRI